MLQAAYIRENKEEVLQRLSKRGEDFHTLLEDILKMDDQRKETQTELDQLLAESNQLAKKIGQLFKEGKQEEGNNLRKYTNELKEKSKALQTLLNTSSNQLKQALCQIPNAPHTSVPKGNTDQDNEIIHQEGSIPSLHDDALPHWELANKYQLIDFERGTKITGAGFPVFTGKGARLQRALVNFFLEEALEAGYAEVQPPHLVNEDSGFGTGQLPDKEGQMYHVTEDNLYLIPTAEVPITNLYRNDLLRKEDLPIKHVGYTPCFRREAGSYGKDVKGLNRLHQFDKVEIVQVVRPENSYKILDEMVEYVQTLLRKLDLPYRVAKLCGGDLGFAATLTFDMEVYSAAQGRWLEVSSVSNFEAFQANRLKLRYKNEQNKSELAHTLNGSALALPRIFAALLENHQRKDGIHIPKALQPFTGFKKIE